MVKVLIFKDMIADYLNLRKSYNIYQTIYQPQPYIIIE